MTDGYDRLADMLREHGIFMDKDEAKAVAYQYFDGVSLPARETFALEWWLDCEAEIGR